MLYTIKLDSWEIDVIINGLLTSNVTNQETARNIIFEIMTQQELQDDKSEQEIK